jgi:hypothetical protein
MSYRIPKLPCNKVVQRDQQEKRLIHRKGQSVTGMKCCDNRRPMNNLRDITIELKDSILAGMFSILFNFTF